MDRVTAEEYQQAQTQRENADKIIKAHEKENREDVRDAVRTLVSHFKGRAGTQPLLDAIQKVAGIGFIDAEALTHGVEPVLN